MPKIHKNMLRTYRRLSKDELLFWIMLKNHGNIVCFSTNVRQCNIAYSVVHEQLCF